MKRILAIALVIFLVIYGLSKYREYQRFNPPSPYDYEISEQIDVNYHDQDLLARYYQQAEELGHYARSVWASEKIDVLHTDRDDPQQQSFAQEYLRKKAELQRVEGKLKNSAQLKQQGFGNKDIINIELDGLSPQNYRLQQSMEGIPASLELKLNDTGQLVYLLQKQLTALGYELEQDGIFKRETQDVVSKFQEKVGLLPTGVVDAMTFKKIYQTGLKGP